MEVYIDTKDKTFMFIHDEDTDCRWFDYDSFSVEDDKVTITIHARDNVTVLSSNYKDEDLCR